MFPFAYKYIRRPLVAVRGSAPRKLLQKIVVERWGTWRWRRSSMGLLSLCEPVGTASPEAPRACFSWRLPALGMGSTLAGVRVFWSWRSVVSEPKLCFVYGFQRWRVFCLPWARILLAFGCFGAGVRLFRNRSFVFYGFQRWREAFCLRVFCLAWARILLVFRSFKIWRWRDFEQPSFGIHVSNGFLLGRGSTAAGVRVFRNRSFVFFLWVPKVTWSILSACFLLGMGSNLAGVSVLSNLTLTRLWAAIVRNPRFERVQELAFFGPWSCYAKVCLAVSHGLSTISLFLVGSKSNVSGFFRLQFRNGFL